MDNIIIKVFTHFFYNYNVRESFGVVPQDIVLFNESLGYNISYGLKPAGEADSDSGKREKEALEKAVKLTKLDGLIDRLPKGFETTVGERGKAEIAMYCTVVK